jgi:hypothetical protein
MTVMDDLGELPQIDMVNSRHSAWGCAGCALKWEGRTMYRKRLIAIDHGDLLQRMEGKDAIEPSQNGLTLGDAMGLGQPLMMYVGADPQTGELNPELENWIQTLRLCSLVKEIVKWHPRLPPQALTKDILNQVVFTLNKRVLSALMTRQNVVMVKACPANGHDRTWRRRLICQDWHNSVEEEGEITPGFLVDHSKLKACSEYELRTLLANCAACVDLDDMVAKVQAKHKRPGNNMRKYAWTLQAAGKAARPEIVERLWGKL